MVSESLNGLIPTDINEMVTLTCYVHNYALRYVPSRGALLARGQDRNTQEKIFYLLPLKNALGLPPYIKNAQNCSSLKRFVKGVSYVHCYFMQKL